MTAVFLASPGPTFLDPNYQYVHSNSTVTTSGSTVFIGYGASQVSLFINIKVAPTGTTPTLQYTIQEVDPGDGTTVFGSSTTGTVITGVGIQKISLTPLYGGSIKISWTVTGTTPSFTQVYATLSAKADSGQVQGIVAAGASISSVNPFLVAGSDGSVARTILTDGIGRLITAPSGANASSDIAYGTVTTTATTNVPVRSTTYTEQTTNAQRSMSSASASDTAAGTGAMTVLIEYYNKNGAGPYTETITLNGTTAVNTVNSDICFIEKMLVMSVGSGGSNVGIITLYAATAGGGGAIGTIAAAANRTFWAHHYTPSGKTTYILSLTGNNSNGTNQSVFTLMAQSIPSTNAVLQMIGDSVTEGAALAQCVRSYTSPLQVAGPAKIILFAAPGGTVSITSRGSFDFYDQ